MNLYRIVKYCAQEVERQGDGPLAVARMFVGWEFITNHPHPHLQLQDIRQLGSRINGNPGLLCWREMPAVFNQGSPALAPEHIGRQLDLLLFHQTDIETDEFVKRFLEIHPFHDGNGRVASLIYNWRNGTLLRPVPLPVYSFV